MNERPQDLSKPASYEELAPTVHWAQRHDRDFGTRWSRRIYDFQLLYVARGQIRVTLLDQSVTVGGGRICLIPSYHWHTVEVLSAPNVSLLGIHFDFFAEISVTSDSDIIVEEPCSPDRLFCAMPVRESMPLLDLPVEGHTAPPGIAELMEEIIDEWNERKSGYLLACRGLLLQLFARLSRSSTEQTRMHLFPKYETELMNLVRELAADCGREWTLSEMAAYLNINTDYMSRLFKLRMGLGPNRYLQTIRHKRAKQLLRETSLSVEEVGNAVGYDDMHYFSRIFRKWEGLSPLQFRKLSRQL